VVDAHLPLHRLTAAQTYLVAWDGDVPVGHTHVAWTGTKLGVPEVQDLFVLPARRREGIATELLCAAERLAAERAHHRMSLGFDVNNVPARRLYEQLGYRNSGLPPERLHGTITIRGRRVELKDTMIYFVKDLELRSPL
jgi:GNAT superfamily N-acetyltransferase